ncbi:MAG: MDR family MFS transporter [Promethearchaeota archaeon]
MKIVSKLTNSFREYPRAFKILIFVTFIDRLGGFLLFPFFSLYITNRFGVGVTEVGILIAIFSAGGIIGSMVGGALADKYGRRALALFGLITSGIGSIVMGLVDNLSLFFIVAAVLGVLGDFGGPARQAMVADLLTKEKQAEGFGLLRVAVNVSATIGPIFGGFLWKQSYMLLFIADAASSLATAVIMFIFIPETKPKPQEGKHEESLIQTLLGYKEVLKDVVYVLFLTVSMLTVIVYMQLNSTLSIFLINFIGMPPEVFGFLISMNAIMVVVLQFWITKRISKYAPMKMMALGTLFYMIGFGMYGFVSETYLYFIAMAIVTIGEMIDIPVSQAAAANFAPEDKRARYMAAFGFHWGIPNLFGVYVSGLVMDNIGPVWIWYFCIILSLVAITGFWVLNKPTKARFAEIKEQLKVSIEELE